MTAGSAAGLQEGPQAGLVEGSEIEVEDAALEAGAGAVTLTGFEPRRARVHSASADIDLALDLKSLDDLTVRSQTGNVVLRVREQLGYEVSAAADGLDALETIDELGAASELDLVRSGLEDTMRCAFQDIRETMKKYPDITDYRTAAYALALDKIVQNYEDIGLIDAQR